MQLFVISPRNLIIVQYITIQFYHHGYLDSHSPTYFTWPFYSSFCAFSGERCRDDPFLQEFCGQFPMMSLGGWEHLQYLTSVSEETEKANLFYVFFCVHKCVYIIYIYIYIYTIVLLL